MGQELNTRQINEFLTTVGRNLDYPATLYLLGGSGLSLLGNPRPTLDIDFDGDEFAEDDFRRLLNRIAAEMQVEIEAVPLHRFIPLPSGTEKRHLFVGAFDYLRVYVFDPYSIALSKLDRGFDSDIEDIVFLLRRGIVSLDVLESMVTVAVEEAGSYDLNPKQMRVHLEVARQGLDAAQSSGW